MLPSTEHALLHRLATEQATRRAPSIVAGVVRAGERIWFGARGSVGSAGQATRPDEDTQYRIGSITKTFVAVLIMQLRDEGKLELTDTVEEHVPGTEFGHLDIAQLLSHTAGMTSESPGSWWERSLGGPWTDLQRSLTDDDLRLRPGRQFHYSNVGYGVLGEIVARLRGASWIDVLRAEILWPLEMHRTSPQPVGKAADGLAVHPFADVVLREPTPDAGAMAPAGQLWSTADDLGRWTAFFGGDTGGVIDPATLAEMRAMATVDDADEWTAGYGLGLQVLRNKGRRLAGHSGSMPGFLACSFIDERTTTGAFVMTNSTGGVAVGDLTVDLITLADQHEPGLPTEWQPSEVDSALLELTGIWHWGPTPFHMHVLSDGLLELIPVDRGRRSRFRQVDKDVWEGLDSYYAGERLRVERDRDGRPAHLNITTFIFTRTPYDASAPIPGGIDDSGWHA